MRRIGPDLRVRIAERRSYFYPDVTVVCGPVQLADSQQDSLTNPAVIVEVLSKTTEACDRGLKFTRYRTIPSMREYCLIAQQEPRIEVYRRQPGDRWLLTEYYGGDAVCRLESLDCELPLSTVYNRDSFETPE